MFRNSTDLKEICFLVDLTIHYRYHRLTVVQKLLVFNLFNLRTNDKKVFVSKIYFKNKKLLSSLLTTPDFLISSKQCRQALNLSFSNKC